MSKEEIKQIIENRIREDGMMETGVKGVQIFRASKPFDCGPAVYEPSVIAIVSGSKETIWNGKSCVYGSDAYMCSTLPMPVRAGIAGASPDNPLLGIYISLDSKAMTELTLDVANASGAIRKPGNGPLPQGMTLVPWGDDFTEALLRILQLDCHPTKTPVLGEGRLRELYYALLGSGAGSTIRRSYGVGNEIARSIVYVTSHLEGDFTIEEMAEKAGMSRAVFHRKFKQATAMSPMQYVKSMRLNKAALMIRGGMNIHDAAESVGYVSPSQFSREFKRMYGQSPKQWSHSM